MLWILCIALVLPLNVYASQADETQKIASSNLSYIADDDVLSKLEAEANAGDAKAQYELARQFERIQKYASVRKYIRNEDIYELYEKAAKQNYIPAQFVLGLMYSKGTLGDQDLVKGYYWMSLAAKQGDELSKPAAEAIKSVMTKEQIAQAEKILENK